jgi:aspartyl-tRNA(Asn)/glutamyl-tRNA(Gln) amidotransferase subunit B
MNYKPVIGLEVHIELKTVSKMFCWCSADYFGKEPNTNTCPTCLGLPGALPYPNKKAIEWCVMIGLALNCEIPLFSKFDRKNYFYPDLPKGYQISQYDMPFCINGNIKLSNNKKIRIRRVHMEEDTGKLIHQKNTTLIDFNRSGVPLVEIVTEPDFESSAEVKEYLQKLQQIVRFLNVSNADMEKGNMRLEPNISLKPIGNTKLPNYKVEVKNINSFSFVGKAIDYEIKRQKEILDKGKIPIQETRGYVEKSSSTISQRIKEEASDYRYFPEPDIPPIKWNTKDIKRLKNLIKGKIPDDKIKELKGIGLSNANATIIVNNPKLLNKFEESIPFAKKANLSLINLSNALINKKVDLNLSSEEIVKLTSILYQKKNIDEKELNKAIDQAIENNPKAVIDFKNGKENAIMFLIGVVKKSLKGKGDANKIKAGLLAKLK